MVETPVRDNTCRKVMYIKTVKLFEIRIIQAKKKKIDYFSIYEHNIDK